MGHALHNLLQLVLRESGGVEKNNLGCKSHSLVVRGLQLGQRVDKVDNQCFGYLHMKGRERGGATGRVFVRESERKEK